MVCAAGVEGGGVAAHCLKRRQDAALLSTSALPSRALALPGSQRAFAEGREPVSKWGTVRVEEVAAEEESAPSKAGGRAGPCSRMSGQTQDCR